MGLEIALIEPEIPQNTGNIIRTCVAIGATLHLVGKLGFSMDDRYLKRAGLDYWYQMSDLHLWTSVEELLQHTEAQGIYYTSTKSLKCYADIAFPDDCLILFGKETKGLPESLLLAHPERMMRIPMNPGVRSLNLSNSAAIVAYEYMRQKGFPGLLREGQLPGLE